MRMHYALPWSIALLLLVWPPAVPLAHADQAATEGSGSGYLGVGFGALNGSTLYHISSYDTTGSGVESELEFPLKTMLVGLEGGFIQKDGKGRDEFSVALRWSLNLGDGSGQLQDSDWLTDNFDINTPTTGAGFPHPGKDVYSLSDITLKANILDLRGSYDHWLSEQFALGPFASLLYQRFSYDASNLHQVGYGPYAGTFTGAVPGPVLTYEVTYIAPFIGVHSQYEPDNSVRMLLDLGYSPFVSAQDRDDHLLRGKVSEGDTTGSAYLALLGIRLSLTDADSIGIDGQYLRIRTTGSQTQRWYRDEPTSTGTILAGTTISGINDRISSDQASLFLQLSHRF